jgi:hypothetical protein
VFSPCLSSSGLHRGLSLASPSGSPREPHKTANASVDVDTDSETHTGDSDLEDLFGDSEISPFHYVPTDSSDSEELDVAPAAQSTGGVPPLSDDAETPGLKEHVSRPSAPPSAPPRLFDSAPNVAAHPPAWTPTLHKSSNAATASRFSFLSKTRATEALNNGSSLNLVPNCQQCGVHMRVGTIGQYLTVLGRAGFDCDLCGVTRAHEEERWVCNDCGVDYCFECMPREALERCSLSPPALPAAAASWSVSRHNVVGGPRICPDGQPNLALHRNDVRPQCAPKPVMREHVGANDVTRGQAAPAGWQVRLPRRVRMSRTTQGVEGGTLQQQPR